MHGGEISDAEDSHELLREAQDLCRKGILKLIDEGEDPDWSAVTLGKDPGS